MATTLTGLLRHDALREWAGDRLFGYGQEYFERDQVYSLKQDEEKITAKVLGLYEYQVQLWAEEDRLAFSCTCPMGESGRFCKHGVAVGLKWLAETGVQTQAAAPRIATDPRDTIKTYLENLDNAALIGLIMNRVTEDEYFREKLLLHIARTMPAGPDLDMFRQVVDTATNAGSAVRAYTYAHRIDVVISALSDMLNANHAAEALELTEYLLYAIEKSIEAVNDPEHHMDEVLYRLQELHLNACRAARPNPGPLARQLFDWRLNTAWDVFYDVMVTYADVFGENGLRVYRALAEKAWSQVPELGPGDKNPDRYGRLRLAYIMESIARQTGDIEAVVAVKRKDLTGPFNFLEIAELYKDRGLHDKALEWAEKGMQAFSERPDPELRDFLVKEYRQRGRNADADALGGGG